MRQRSCMFGVACACIVACATIGVIVIRRGASIQCTDLLHRSLYTLPNCTTNSNEPPCTVGCDVVKFFAFVDGIVIILVGGTLGLILLLRGVLTSTPEPHAEEDIRQILEIPHGISQCCICLVDLDTDIVMLSLCNHAFHEKCLKQWLEIRRVCPLCIAEV